MCRENNTRQGDWNCEREVGVGVKVEGHRLAPWGTTYDGLLSAHHHKQRGSEVDLILLVSSIR